MNYNLNKLFFLQIASVYYIVFTKQSSALNELLHTVKREAP